MRRDRRPQRPEAGYRTTSAFAEEAERRLSLAALGLAAVLGVGAYAVATRWADGVAEGVLALPALYAVAVSAAALLSYLLYARARVCDDERLRWLGAGYAVAGAAALLQALTLPGFAVADPFGTSANGAAALYLVWHATIPTFALVAVTRPGAVRARRMLVGAVLCALALAAWEPAALSLPTLVASNGPFTAPYRSAVGLLTAYAAAVAAAWAVAAGRHPTWPEAWITVSLVVLTFDLALGAAALSFFGPAWWASAALRAATFALPAMGLLTEFVRLFDALRCHERSLAERVGRELELAVRTRRSQNGDGGSPEAVARIQAVLEDGAFSMVFQPVFDLRTGEQSGAEALARFTATPQRAPDLWFAEAALVGRGTDLELAAVRRALTGLPHRPPEMYLAVNVSPDTVLDAQFGALCATMPGCGLVLEITEHAQVDDYARLKDALRELRAHGAQLAIDDAGAGFASLRHIVRLEPDVIKLDVSLVRDVHLDPVRRSLASSLVVFAEEIGSVMVAEGIETAEELEVLKQLGVHFGQGYYLARPGPHPWAGAAGASQSA